MNTRKKCFVLATFHTRAFAFSIFDYLVGRSCHSVIDRKMSKSVSAQWSMCPTLIKFFPIQSNNNRLTTSAQCFLNLLFRYFLRMKYFGFFFRSSVDCRYYTLNTTLDHEIEKQMIQRIFWFVFFSLFLTSATS